MQEFQSELGQVEVAPEEVRQILQRLAASDFGGSDSARIDDIAELTGTSTETIGRILAELRGDTWEQWQESVRAEILNHQQRIHTLENQISRGTNQDADIALFERVESGRIKKTEEKNQKMVSRILILMLVIAYGMVLYTLVTQGIHAEFRP